jgi:hypothetical protein
MRFVKPEFYNQWKEVFSYPNWRDLTFVHLAVETDHLTGVFTLQLGLLGLNLTLSLIYDEDAYEEMQEKLARMFALRESDEVVMGDTEEKDTNE